jgi:hypothetical protein
MSIVNAQLNTTAPSITFSPSGSMDQAVNVNVTGTYGACSLAFEQSNDNGQTFFPLNVTRQDTGATTSSHALTANTTTVFIAQSLTPAFMIRLTANPAPATGNINLSLTSYPQTTSPISGTIVPTKGKFTDRSGSIVAPNTAQQLMAANVNRRFLFIQNLSTNDLWINFTIPAVIGQPSLKLPSNSGFSMEGSFVTTEAVSVIGSTTGQTWCAKEG